MLVMQVLVEQEFVVVMRVMRMRMVMEVEMEI